MNDYQKRRFSSRIVKDMFNTVTGKKIAIFGFAFKKDTGDTRETAAAYVMKDLLEERAVLSVYDPQVTREMMFGELDYTLNTTETTLPGLHGMVTTAATALEAARGAHAIAVLTEWDEFVTTGKPPFFLVTSGAYPMSKTSVCYDRLRGGVQGDEQARLHLRRPQHPGPRQAAEYRLHRLRGRQAHPVPVLSSVWTVD